MKKGKQNFKVLTDKEAKNIKGGGWFDWFSSIYNSWASQNQAAGTSYMTTADECPPPEPPDSE